VDHPPQSRELMRDGKWLVPEEQRPENWRSLRLREEVTVTKTTRTATLEAQPQTEVTTAHSVEVDPLPDPPKLISFIPERCIAEDEIVSKSLEFWGVDHSKFPTGDDDSIENDGYVDSLTNDLSDLAEEVFRHRKVKARVDEALTNWIGRHRRQIRHLGVGSAAVRDLWITVYGLLIEHGKVADKESA